MRTITPALLLTFLSWRQPSAAEQSSFRSSLTATVIIRSADAAGNTGDSNSTTRALGCRVVTLRWSARRGASRFAVYVSGRSGGPWLALPDSNVCGKVRWTPPTSVVDVEPTRGAPAVVHRLYYKVVALGPEASPSVLDVTDPVDVEFP